MAAQVIITEVVETTRRLMTVSALRFARTGRERALAAVQADRNQTERTGAC